MLQLLRRLAPKNPWHFVWISAVASVIFTTLLNTIQSFLWFGRMAYDLLIIGTLDAIVVSVTVAPLVIYIIVSDRERMESELRALSLTDELTGLNNRRGFFTLAEQELRMAVRTRRGLYLIYADIDDFKWVNDNFGHEEGDRVLVDVARMLKVNYRDSDIIARIGGDEFLVLLVETTKDDTRVITERFAWMMDRYNDTDGRKYPLSISIGLAYFDPKAPCSIDDLLKHADGSMYAGKRLKRDAVH